MRLLSALNHGGIEEYLKCLTGITSVDIVKDKRSLLEIIDCNKFDLVLLSKELPGSEKMEYLLETLSSEQFKSQRIIYIYGEYDNLCDCFISLLIKHAVYDFFVGEEITSKDIEKLIFRPTCKETAFSYFNSHFDNNIYFNHKQHRSKQDRHLFNSISLIDTVLKPILKTKSHNKANYEKLIISIISNHSTGKSHTAWNLGYCFSKSGYSTSLINVDRGYSANLFFDIDDIYYNLLDFTIQNNKHKDILDHCFAWRNLHIITGRLGDEKEIDSDDFFELLYSIRTKSDITIIDTRTGLSALTRLSIKSSTYDLLIFDCDIMHFHFNMSMLAELKDDFVPEKTIAVINNTNVKASSHKFIYNELINSGIPFKDIAFISSCGILSSEVMHTGQTPYQAVGGENKSFTSDMDSLLDKLSTRSERSGYAASIFRK